MQAAQSADLPLFRDSKTIDGLKLDLEIFVPNKVSFNDVKVTCRLTNVSNSAIPYGYRNAARGFSLELRDLSKKAVPYTKEGQSLFGGEGRYFKYSVKELEPGESIEFTTTLGDVFELPKDGLSSLALFWDRGMDGSGNVFPEIKGLEVSIDITSLNPVK